MKIYLILVFVLAFSFASNCQNRILYDLDSYKRVDGEYRTTFITPDVKFDYKDVINSPDLEKILYLRIGGDYQDYQIYNDEHNQITKYRNFRLDVDSGQNDNNGISFNTFFDNVNRSYDDNLKYFKNGLNLATNSSYRDNLGLSKRYVQTINLGYELGFGFGRIEIVNNAWLGGRILEELQNNNLLTEIPTANEMKLFFDLIGDLEFERVMDNRLRFIYRIERIIEYVEKKGWIEKGSVPAFAIIYDTFRYENFIFRKSGERLEFTLTPTFFGNLSYQRNVNDPFSKFIQGGFYGDAEYEINRNGDLEYYTTKVIGGRLGYLEEFRDNDVLENDVISGNLYFEYRYRYLPSLRTNLEFSTNVSAGFIQSYFYQATLSVSTILEYNYYFSPATQLVLITGLMYNDTEFQRGDYQPEIRANFSMNVVHALN